MNDHVYKHIELTGTSPDGIEAAVERAVAQAAHSVRSMRWLEVLDTRAHITDGRVDQWQVTVRIAFTVEE